MTFLQLVQELVRIAGMVGEGGPPIIGGQRGEHRRAIEFVRIAYEDVCNLHFDWDFLWATDVHEIEPGLDVYPAPNDLGIWDAERIFLDGEPLRVIEWADHTPDAASPSRPHTAVIRPDNQLLLLPPPSDAHMLAFDYFRRAAPLVDGGDQPLIPEQFQRVILGRALVLYGNYEAAQEVVMQGAELYRVYLSQLEKHQLRRRQQTHGRQGSAEITVVAS